MSNHYPLVSIGMPVYNGQNYLRQAVDSILCQTHGNFELIISDNGSTDCTESICREYAAKDARVRYFRNEKNIGASRNFNRVFELSSGPYFKWAAHDDVLHPEFLEKCVRVLEDSSSVVLCFAKSLKIDNHGHMTGTYDTDNSLCFDGPTPRERFREVMRLNYWVIAVFGVIRAHVLKTTPLIGAYVGSDRCLLAELSLSGRIYRVPEHLFYRRDHTESSVRVNPDPQLQIGWYDTRKQGKLCFPHWRYGLENWKSVTKTPMNLFEKLACYRQILGICYTMRTHMGADLHVAAERTLNRHKIGRDLIAARRQFLQLIK
jgi:glycosyltransferase involved in cell wall biosynthesis